MKTPAYMRQNLSVMLLAPGLVCLSLWPGRASVLFEDDFKRGFPGWTVVQPLGIYYDGPLRWQYDIVTGAFVEQSNIYTDSATYSPSAIAPMLINDTVTGASFTYTARLTAGDDDGFGLIFGYQNETNFYRVVFARQARSGGFPWNAWVVDRTVNGVVSSLFGYGTPGYVQTFRNTANRPFDVAIAVDAQNQLTLSVVDNPTGTPTSYPLVTGQTLPSAANGQVGIFTWNMSGGTPRGFRIQNLSLSPLALSGEPSGLTNWTALIPPRATGHSTAQTGQPFWSLAMGRNGPEGILEEIGDCYQGNDLFGRVDFTGPTLVAGNDTWSNYVVGVRLTPRDDDGQGLLLRYQNATNFYRVALRSESSTTGPPQGLSVQQNVNRVYTEVYKDNPVKYNPAPTVTYDLLAAIATNALSITLVSDPEGAVAVYEYGPFNVTGVDSGKIGLFSWGMTRTEFDWVSVQDGAGLYVSAPHGAPTPAKGLSSFATGTLVNASAGDPVTNLVGIRRFPTGWTGAGSVPTSGSGSAVTFQMDTFSRLHWLWRTEYRLLVTNGPGGTVSYPPGEWFPAGTDVTVIAQPNAGYMVAGWTGDLPSVMPTLNFTMDAPCTLVAIFATDSDADGLPDEWELTYFGNLAQRPNDDPDGDLRPNLEEYRMGTDPSLPPAPELLRITSLELTSNTAILSISNSSGSRFNLQVATNLAGPWTTVATTQFLARCTSAVPAGAQSFWRLQQPGRPAAVPAFVPGSWTLVVLPDTQLYSEQYPELFKDQARWIVANKDRYNIKYVLHLGDLVDDDTAVQWTDAQAALTMLDGQVPYALVTGNHDYSTFVAPRLTLFNSFFPLSKYQVWPTFGGVREAGRLDNSYHLFSAGGADWLVLALEFGPRNGTVAWANQIASNYPARKKILITHAYLYADATRYDWATKGATQIGNPHEYGTGSDPDGTNDGEELWQKLVKVSTNWVMTICGHVWGYPLGRLSSTNNFGEVVHQMLMDYQDQALGGEARLLLMEFRPDGRTVQVKAYSPLLGNYRTDTPNQFTLTLQPPLP